MTVRELQESGSKAFSIQPRSAEKEGGTNLLQFNGHNRHELLRISLQGLPQALSNRCAEVDRHWNSSHYWGIVSF